MMSSQRCANNLVAAQGGVYVSDHHGAFNNLHLVARYLHVVQVDVAKQWQTVSVQTSLPFENPKPIWIMTWLVMQKLFMSCCKLRKLTSGSEIIGDPRG
ncbi:hypothetical protein [Pseudoalteromonas sp. S16_S37]|uniref:hypothetical protein n=1 Tax=Pseudoalteromonas sp. S16_S37 TaxID=2720228 RepID=UPI0016810C2C|nr:hypothetical protein [Pseudoalteromonas sp. S16_S37]MBD1581116.1 hypothetical protein [Pseudoalteromonas sp. S16_S37]